MSPARPSPSALAPFFAGRATPVPRPPAPPASWYPYPANPGNTGYLNAPGYPGSLTTTALTASGLVTGTTYEYLLFPGGLGGITTSNVTFTGCCFASNAVEDANVSGSFATGCSNVTFSYCTFQPSAVSAPPVAFGSGYEYGIDQRKIAGLTVDHCDFWGFANGLELSTSSLSSPTVITYNFIHDPSDNGGGTYHVDGILSSNGGTGIEYVTVSHNTIVIPGSEDTNCIGFQVPAGGGGSAYSNLVITGNYLAGDNIMLDVGTGLTCTDITFTGNMWGADYEPQTGPLYSSAGFTGAGCTWSGNTMYVPVASPFDGASATWMAAANSGLYWWPGDGNPAGPSSIIGHVSDF